MNANRHVRDLNTPFGSRRPRWQALLYAAILLAFPVHSWAEGFAGIEEVVVTATKREESLQDVPVAVTALSPQDLERAGVKDLRDLDTVATSFNMNSSQTETGGSTLRIRGVGTTGNNTGLESAVGVFLDGVYLSRPGVALGDLMDVQQIEVLRGPQGTLFGRNTSAGAVSISTQKPNSVENEYFANLTTSNFDGVNVQAGASGPLSGDNLAYRVSASVRNQSGFLDSTTGAESRTRDRFSLRGQLLWDLSPNADLRLIADLSESDEECCDAITLVDSPARALGSFGRAGLAPDGGIQALGDTALEDLKSNAEQFRNGSEQAGVSAELNWDVSEDASLTWLVSYRKYESTSEQQSDFVNIDVFSATPEVTGGHPVATEIDTWTSELRLAGDTERISWMVGAYISDEYIDTQGGVALGADFAANTDAILWNFAFGPALAAAPLLAPIPLATGGTFGDVLAALRNPALSPTVAFAGGADPVGAWASNGFTQDGQSYSVFTHNTIYITEDLGLLVGLRWVDEKKDGDYNQVEASNNLACANTARNGGALIGATAGTPLAAAAVPIAQFSIGYLCFPFAVPAGLPLPGSPVEFADTYEDDELVYTVKLSYDLNESTSGYVGFTHGFKSGGFNLDPSAAIGGANPIFAAETNDAWEMGLKTQFLDNRIRANIAIWDYALEDFQVLEFTGIQFQTFNVSKAESRGAEVEVMALLSENLNFNLGYTLSKSEYPDDCVDASNTNIPGSVQQLCGNPLTNSPENTVTLGFGYDGYVRDFAYFLAGNYRWADERRTSTNPGPANNPVAYDYMDDNFRLNLRAGLGAPDESWMIEVWGNNVTDERVRNLTFNVPLRSGARASFMEAPRTYGVTLRTRF